MNSRVEASPASDTGRSAQRWNAVMLLTLFVAVLLMIGVLIHLVMASLSLALGVEHSFSRPSASTLIVIVTFWLVMALGSILRLRDVRAGGAVLARRYGAVQASNRSRHEDERVLLSVVAEMSIASRTAQPQVFVLRHEPSVNAFVLGHRRAQPVIVVTAGALEAFDRDQLQAVVAHEFAHISNGDLLLDMRLLVFLGGLTAIDELGHCIKVRNSFFIKHLSRSIGRLVCLCAKPSVFAGQVISSAFSRQREFRADASAVQFTDNPFALAYALDIVFERSYEPALHGVHALELAHVCFQSGAQRRRPGALLASHPDIPQRIQAIKAIKTGQPPGQQTPGLTDQTSPDELRAFTSDAVAPLPDGRVTDRLALLLAEDADCLAALFALFVPRHSARRNDYLNALGFSFNNVLVTAVRNVMQKIPDELLHHQPGLVMHATGILRAKLSHEHRQKVVIKMEQLLIFHNGCHLVQYAKVQFIRQHLGVEFPLVTTLSGVIPAKARARKVPSVDTMSEHFALLISMIVDAFVASRVEQELQFTRVLKCYTQEQHPRRTINEVQIFAELESAFQALYVQPQSIRRAFIGHCQDLIRSADRSALHAANSENKAQLDMLAVSLRCNCL